MFVKLTDTQYTSAQDLGGKGSGLVEMYRLGLPIPPAIIIPTFVCRSYLGNPGPIVIDLGKRLPDIRNQLQIGEQLVSVRSGAKDSMPGMMDTILNVGMNKDNFNHFKSQLGSTCAIDCATRLIKMYGAVVGIPPPDDLDAQLLMSIEAVFNSWNTQRAKDYRDIHGIDHNLGTAVVVQQMVYGNRDDKSCTGIIFTRNGDSGANEFQGEWLPCAQGEDIVTHVTPKPLSAMQKWNPKVLYELEEIAAKVEDYYKDAMEIEFTVESGKVWILQVKKAKRTSKAAIRIALDFHDAGIIDFIEMVKRISPRDYHLAQQPMLDPKFKKKPHFTGIPACSGVATGKPVYSAEEAQNCTEPCILVTLDTNVDDIKGMHKAAGIITMNGGATAHAAVCARDMNKPCIVGVGVSLAAFRTKRADASVVSIDGESGSIWFSEVPVIAGGREDVDRLTAMILKDANITPIDTHLGDKVLIDLSRDTLDVEKCIAKAMKAIKEGREVTLSFSRDSWSKQEIEFFSQIGHDALAHVTAVDLVVANLELELPEGAKVTLIGAHSNKMTSIVVVDSLESLILAETPFILMTEGKAVDWALKKKKEEGIECFSFKETYRSIPQLVGEVLGGTV